MNPSKDNMSVFGESGKVHAITNLRIVDASILPSCVRTNTNVPTMMIAERVYQLISEGL
jgi:5-(hydroxymethyl)furfural/furfural oxidase